MSLGSSGRTPKPHQTCKSSTEVLSCLASQNANTGSGNSLINDFIHALNENLFVTPSFSRRCKIQNKLDIGVFFSLSALVSD